jgi:hypothetical protein
MYNPIRVSSPQEAAMGREDRDGFGGSMKRSAGNAMGNTIGCFFGIVIIVIMLMALAQGT